jgi:hypothetical protein
VARPIIGPEVQKSGFGRLARQLITKTQVQEQGAVVGCSGHGQGLVAHRCHRLVDDDVLNIGVIDPQVPWWNAVGDAWPAAAGSPPGVEVEVARDDEWQVTEGSIPDFRDPLVEQLPAGDHAVPNLRKLAELPYQQAHGGCWDELYETLTDFRFLERKVATAAVDQGTDARGRTLSIYAGVYALQDDFDLALRLWPSDR